MKKITLLRPFEKPLGCPFPIVRVFLFILFFLGGPWPSFSAGDPTDIEDIREYIRQEFKASGNKKRTAIEYGVDTRTLKKFIDGEEIQQKTLDAITKRYEELNDSSPPSSEDQDQRESQGSSTPPDSPIQSSASRDFRILDIDALPFSTAYPGSYSLLMLDFSRIPPSDQDGVAGKQGLAEVKARFLKSDLRTDVDPSLGNNGAPSIDKKKRLFTKEEALPDNVSQKFYVFQLYSKRERPKAAALLEDISGQPKLAYEGDDFSGGLILFPFSSEKAMAYGFGSWESLLNPACIVPQWGVRLLSSAQVCNPEEVKSVKADDYRSENPKEKQEKAKDLCKIENFNLEVGSEELQTITLKPKGCVQSEHCMTGRRHLHFDITPSEDKSQQETLDSLHQIARSLYDLTEDKEFCIHPRMLEFLDDEIKNPDLLKELDELLPPLFSATARTPIFASSVIWREMGSKKVVFGQGRKKTFFEAVAAATLANGQFPEKILARREEGGNQTKRELIVRHSFSTPPMEYREDFYRFDCGSWYRVDESRFDAIIRMLRSVKKPSSSLNLPDYTKEDAKGPSSGASDKKAEGEKPKGVDYKEARYNIRAVKEINEVEGWQAILLDRINIYFGGIGNKFEFADILAKHGDDLHLIHIKRAKASDLSHHREQVERCAEYLKSELKKKNAQETLLQGIVNGLYEENNLPVRKLGKSQVFSAYQKKLKPKKESPRNFFGALKNQNDLDGITNKEARGNVLKEKEKNLEKKEKESAPKDDGLKKKIDDLKEEIGLIKKEIAFLEDVGMSKFITQVMGIKTSEDFKNHPGDFAVVLDALYSCAFYKGTLLPDDVVSRFLKGALGSFSIRELLFAGGPQKADAAKNIRIVLAVIDDRAIDAKNKKEKLDALAAKEKVYGEGDESSPRALFNKQDLWGLDRTCLAVGNAGKHFDLVVINEITGKNWDALGLVEPKEKGGKNQQTTASQKKPPDSRKRASPAPLKNSAKVPRGAESSRKVDDPDAASQGHETFQDE